MFSWFKKSNSQPINLVNLRRQINDLKTEQSYFVGEANDLLATTEKAIHEFDQGMNILKQEDRELVSKLNQIDRDFK